MSAVKLMTSTRDFDNMEEGARRCQNDQTIEECLNERLVAEAVELCQCLPHLVRKLENGPRVNNTE